MMELEEDIDQLGGGFDTTIVDAGYGQGNLRGLDKFAIYGN
jgi:hypothetical protein